MTQNGVFIKLKVGAKGDARGQMKDNEKWWEYDSITLNIQNQHLVKKYSVYLVNWA